MSSYLEEMMLRLVEMEKEAITTADAADNPLHWQESFPYFTNQLGPVVYSNTSEELSVREYTVIIRYIVGHMTEGYTGQPIRSIYVDMPTIEDYLVKHQLLTTNAGTYASAPLQYLAPMGARLVSAIGLTVSDNSGLGTKQVGAQFTLSVLFNITADQEW